MQVLDDNGPRLKDDLRAQQARLEWGKSQVPLWIKRFAYAVGECERDAAR